MTTLHLMVGLPCSGKTTLAQKLEHERSALRLTPDEWQVGLFGQDAKEPEHDARHSFIEAMLWNIASRALELGTNVIPPAVRHSSPVLTERRKLQLPTKRRHCSRDEQLCFPTSNR